MTDWQPIETAPKDGTFVILKGGEHDEGYGAPCVVAFWDGRFWVYAYWDTNWRSSYRNPTHWMPIPK